MPNQQCQSTEGSIHYKVYALQFSAEKVLKYCFKNN